MQPSAYSTLATSRMVTKFLLGAFYGTPALIHALKLVGGWKAPGKNVGAVTNGAPKHDVLEQQATNFSCVWFHNQLQLPQLQGPALLAPAARVYLLW